MTKRRKILSALVVMLWLQTILNFGIVKVDGISMQNTLTDGKYYVYTNKDLSRLKRFDIVLVESENLQKMIIKRVVGFPNEEVKMKQGKLYINNEEVIQDFNYIQEIDNFEITLGADEYFVMGDNRPNSIDSRYIGPINSSEIKHVLVNKKY